MATKRKTEPTPADPLADLREEVPAGLTDVAQEAQERADEAQARVEALEATGASLAFQEDAQTALVAAWHRDAVTKGAIHQGGMCICGHMARVALATLAGKITIQANDDGGEDAQGGDAK